MGDLHPAGTEVGRRGALGVGFVAIPVSAEMLPALPPMSFDTMLLLLVGIPAWAMALFTLALWFRSHNRRRMRAAEKDARGLRPPGAMPNEER